MKRSILTLMFCLVTVWVGAQQVFQPEQHRKVETDRADGRFLSTYGIAHAMLRDTKPKFAFTEDIDASNFATWQKGLHDAMRLLMNHPETNNQPSPVCVSTEQKEGYTLQKWEFYPLPHAVSTFFVLVPDGLKKQVPGVLCIPGSHQPKEYLTGELPSRNMRSATAMHLVKKGYIAVVVDNPSTGEASDLEDKELKNSDYDYDNPSRIFLELGWSWLGYTSYLDMQVLEWMKQHPSIRKDRIVVSGFSLGTEPMMVLGCLDESIYAFVYNDFLCQTQERALSMTVPNQEGHREFPNSIRHLIPGWWNYFNFPDVVASLAPRPVILTEGGLDRDFDLIHRAYKVAGYPENVETHHYKKFEDASMRKQITQVPEGLTRKEFFETVNVDPGNHYYKNEFIMDWFDRIMK